MDCSVNTLAGINVAAFSSELFAGGILTYVIMSKSQQIMLAHTSREQTPQSSFRTGAVQATEDSSAQQGSTAAEWLRPRERRTPNASAKGEMTPKIWVLNSRGANKYHMYEDCRSLINKTCTDTYEQCAVCAARACRGT